MSHRTSDDARDKVHHATHPKHVSDHQRHQAVTAFTSIVAGRYHGDRQPEADAAVVAALGVTLARVAVVPGALAVACPEHGAAAGEFCTRGIRYVCMPRVWVGRAS